MSNLSNNHASWLSAYIFFPYDIYTVACDQIIHDLVAPFIQTCLEKEWIARYFFIRYTENGSHIRLRLDSLPDTQERHIKPALQTAVEAMNARIKASMDAAQAESIPPLFVQWVPYEPEVNRYGGPTGVQLAETFFQYSSATTCLMIEDIIAGGQTTRLGRALLLMTVLTHTFLPDRTQAALFLKNYSISYLRTRARDETSQANWVQAFNQGLSKQSDTLGMYVDEVWARLETADSLSPHLDQYHQFVSRIKDKFETLLTSGQLLQNDIALDEWPGAVWAIVPSYMHMMNNRLGVRIEDETYLSFLMTHTLDDSIEYIVP